MTALLLLWLLDSGVDVGRFVTASAQIEGFGLENMKLVKL
jgi:hypothetical protein